MNYPTLESHDCPDCGSEMSMILVEKPSGWRCMACLPMREEEIRYIPKAAHEALQSTLVRAQADLDAATRRIAELEKELDRCREVIAGWTREVPAAIDQILYLEAELVIASKLLRALDRSSTDSCGVCGRDDREKHYDLCALNLFLARHGEKS